MGHEAGQRLGDVCNAEGGRMHERSWGCRMGRGAVCKRRVGHAGHGVRRWAQERGWHGRAKARQRAGGGATEGGMEAGGAGQQAVGGLAGLP